MLENDRLKPYFLQIDLENMILATKNIKIIILVGITSQFRTELRSMPARPQVVPLARRAAAAAAATGARARAQVVREGVAVAEAGVPVLLLVGGAALAAEQARAPPEEAPGAPGAEVGHAGDLVGEREAALVDGDEGDHALLDLLSVLGADARRVPRRRAQVQRVAAVPAAASDTLPVRKENQTNGSCRCRERELCCGSTRTRVACARN